MDDTGQQTYVDSKARVVPDLTHHLSDLAKARKPSPLKALAAAWGKPGLISLAGGMPHPDYFPYDSISAQVLPHDAYDPNASSSSTSTTSSINRLWNWLTGAANDNKRLEEINIPKFSSGGLEDVQLSVALQYSTALGMVKLQKFIQEFSMRVYKPYLPTTQTLLHTGNTDGWNKVVITLCNQGDSILTEDWTYPSALVAASPLGVIPVPVLMDAEGMRAEVLEDILENWDASVRGSKKPHVMYTVPIGQNPSGATMLGERKKEIYEVCVKHDILIIEDDPYFFLQEGHYSAPHLRNQTQSVMDPEPWIATLAPSFIKFDYEGRVIRLDTFSKTIAPGSRLGFFTCNPMFAERLLRASEVSSQAPCGFGQSLITQLLAEKWGFDKYIRWLQGLQNQYTRRRDLLIDAMSSTFHLSEEVSDSSFLNGTSVLVARERRNDTFRAEKYYGSNDTSWFSFVPPTSGMFVWVKIHLYNHPAYRTKNTTETLEKRLWLDLLENNVLFAPGWIFSTEDDVAYPPDDVIKTLLNAGRPAQEVPVDGDHSPAYCHFRIAFSSATEKEMVDAMKIFARVMKNFFQETS